MLESVIPILKKMEILLFSRSVAHGIKSQKEQPVPAKIKKQTADFCKHAI